jgi:hypothetical protein
LNARGERYRRILASALFSFGAVCGAFSVIRLSDGLSERLYSFFVRMFSRSPIPSVVSSVLFWPVLACLFGLSPPGAFFICFSLLAAGFSVGVWAALGFRVAGAVPAAAAVIIPASFAFSILAAAALRISALLRRQCSGSFALLPDYGYYFAQIGYAAAALLLCAASVSVFVSIL